MDLVAAMKALSPVKRLRVLNLSVQVRAAKSWDAKI